VATVSDARHVMTLADTCLARGESLLLMTDFDGTLTPIVDDPSEAWLSDVMRGVYTLDPAIRPTWPFAGRIAGPAVAQLLALLPTAAAPTPRPADAAFPRYFRFPTRRHAQELRTAGRRML